MAIRIVAAWEAACGAQELLDLLIQRINDLLSLSEPPWREMRLSNFARRCPVCGRTAERGRASDGDFKQFECAKCGRYQLTGTAAAVLPSRLDDCGPMASARLSHSLQRLQRNMDWPLVSTEELDALISAKLPSPDEQLSNLISWIIEEAGDDVLSPVKISYQERLASVIGAKDAQGTNEIVKYAIKKGLLRSVTLDALALTFEGSRSMKDSMNEKLTLVDKDGEVVKSEIMGRIVNQRLLTFDSALPVRPGDRFLRHLPSGLEEEFIVEDPGYHEALRGMPAHYQAKIRRSDAPPQILQNIINNIQGDNARVNIQSTDNSLNLSDQRQQVRIFDDLRECLKQIDADVERLEAIRVSIDEMEASKETQSFKEKYKNFLAVASNHISVFGPLITKLADWL